MLKPNLHIIKTSKKGVEKIARAHYNRYDKLSIITLITLPNNHAITNFQLNKKVWKKPKKQSNSTPTKTKKPKLRINAKNHMNNRILKLYT